jgi:predicted Zn-dependent protease
MITLEMNHNRMGMMSRGREWYTAEVGKLGSIHVHNSNGVWTFRITVIHAIDSTKSFTTKEQAYNAALDSFTKMVAQALNELTATERLTVEVDKEVTK